MCGQAVVPTIRTAYRAISAGGHWSLCAWTTLGAVLVREYQDRTDPQSPPNSSECAVGARTWNSGNGARELCLVYAADGQRAWRAYQADFRARHPRRKAAA
jgi:hypothetical protein